MVDKRGPGEVKGTPNKANAKIPTAYKNHPLVQPENAPILNIWQKLFLLFLMVISFPLAFAGTWARTGKILPECFLEFPPQNCIVPKAAYNEAFYLSIAACGVVFFLVLFIFPFIFPPADHFFQHFVRRSVVHAHVYPAWGYFGTILMCTFWFLMWVQPAFAGNLLHFTFVPLWVGFILTLDGIVYYRTGESLISRNAAAFAHIFIMSGLGWLYFEFMGYFTQNWYYPINHIWSEKGYIIWYALCYTTIFPSLFEWADLLSTFTFFKTAYSNGPKISLPRWLQYLVLCVSAYGCFAMSRDPTDSLWMAFEWLAPMFFAGFGLNLVGYPSPWSNIAHGDYGKLVIFGMSGLIDGIFWEGWNYWSAPNNPSYWKYDIPFLNAFYVFEMPIVGFLGYIPFGICCWTMWLISIAILNPPQPLTWKNAWVWGVIGIFLYARVFYVADWLKQIVGVAESLV